MSASLEASPSKYCTKLSNTLASLEAITLIKLLVLFLALQLSVLGTSKPLLPELSLKKSFDFSFKPIIPTLTFIKEKLLPFGSFGFKKEIAKRDVSEVGEFEDTHVNEKGSTVHKDILNKPEFPDSVEIKPGKKIETDGTVLNDDYNANMDGVEEDMYTSLDGRRRSRLVPENIIPVSNVLHTNIKPVHELQEPKPILSAPPVSSLPQTNLITPPEHSPQPVLDHSPPLMQTNPSVTPPTFSPPPLLTPELITSYNPEFINPIPTVSPINPTSVLPAVETAVSQTQSEVSAEVKPSLLGGLGGTGTTIARGSKVALYFSSVILEILTQLVTNARSTLIQYNN